MSKLCWTLLGGACFAFHLVNGSVWAADASEKLKWTFQNMEVKALLQSLAEIGKQNLIVAESIGGVVSLHLNDMTWREAFEVVLNSVRKSSSVRNNQSPCACTSVVKFC